MKITKSADFALRILIHLARENKPITMPVLSQNLDVSYNHLSKIVLKLKKAQFVRTTQGKFGGVRLFMNPNNITMKAVVELIDGPVHLSDCLDENAACKFACSCKLKESLSNIQNKINGLLTEVTVENLI